MEMLESPVSSHFSVIYQVALSYHYVPFYPLTFSGKPFCSQPRQGVNSQESIPLPVSGGSGCADINQLPNCKAYVLHLSAKSSWWNKLQSPTVEIELLMYLLLVAFLPLYYFSTFCPVFHELSVKQLALSSLPQGSASGGTQTKACSNSAPTVSLALSRIPKKGKYGMCKEQQLNGKESTSFQIAG